MPLNIVSISPNGHQGTSIEPQMPDQVVRLRDAQGKRGTARAVPDRSKRDLSKVKADPERGARTTSGTDARPDTHDTRHEALDHAAQAWLSRLTHGLPPAAQTNDPMAWNADATRMPYRMQSEYLRKLHLNIDLAEGRLKVDGRPVHVSDIRVPIFAVGTLKDHAAPWRSAFKIDRLSDTDATFALTSGGHIAQIASEPGHLRRTNRVRHRKAGDLHMDPDIWDPDIWDPRTWLNRTPEREGSW